MVKSRKKILIVSLILALAVSACGQLNSGSPAAPTRTPFEDTPQPTYTPYNNPDATLTPYVTTTPYTSAATRTPYAPMEGETGPLNQIGPWMVFITGSSSQTNQGNQLWAANPDGSGLTLAAENFFNVNTNIGSVYLHPLASPAGGHIAYFALGADGLTPELHIVSLPSIVDQTITPLYSLDTLQDAQATQDVILNKVTSMAWSPDGSRLAFIAALEGETADLYLLDIASGTITRMTEEPGQAYMPVWSQDGEWILYSAASEFFSTIGDSPVFFQIDGIWAVRADQSEIRELSGPVEEPNFLRYQPWYGSRFIIDGYNSLCGSDSYCWLDVENDQSAAIPYQLIDYSVSPTTGEILLIDHTQPTAAGPAPAIYINPDEPEGRQASTGLTSPQWMPYPQVFAAKTDSQPYLQVEIIANGEIFRITNWHDYPASYMFLAASPNILQVAWYRYVNEFETGLWLGTVGEQHLEKVFSGEVQDVVWAEDSSGLFFISDKYDSAPTDYIQGVYYTTANNDYIQLVKEISVNDYANILGWCGE